MLDTRVDKDTPEQLLTSFKEISGGRDKISKSQIQQNMDPGDAEYLLAKLRVCAQTARHTPE